MLMFLVDDIFTAINLQTNFIGLQKDFTQHGNTFEFEFSFLIQNKFRTIKTLTETYLAEFSKILQPDI